MYIGWDIGIKNLSYCILDIIDNNDVLSNSDDIIEITNKTTTKNKNITTTKKFKIMDWGVINIVDNVSKGANSFNDRTDVNCGLTQCKKKAAYIHKDKTNDCYVGLCTVHFKKINESEKCDFLFNEKIPICYSQECKKKSTYYFKSHEYKTYCGIHHKQPLKDPTNGECVKVDRKIKATHINLTKLASCLYTLLDEKPQLLNVKTVLLENQPVLKNPTMKTMQIFLYSYYVLRGITDKQNAPIEKITCYSANQKNKLITLLDTDQQTYIKEVLKDTKNKYTRNKKEGIMITERILSHKMKGSSTKWKDMFDSSKKKDDLADSLLMTIHYLLK